MLRVIFPQRRGFIHASVMHQLQGALAKLTADREEQAALRQVEVQQLKYTHEQQIKVGRSQTLTRSTM